MSRPSMTMPPSAPSSRWRATSTARTRGSRATAAAARSISGVRIARVTSAPSMMHGVRDDHRCARARRCAATACSSSSATRACERLPADGAVHRAAVDVAVAERRGDGTRDGALAGAGRAVDGDDECTHEFGKRLPESQACRPMARRPAIAAHLRDFRAISVTVRLDNGTSAEDPLAGRHRVAARVRAADARGPRHRQRRDGPRARHEGRPGAGRHPRRRPPDQDRRSATATSCSTSRAAT